MPEFPEFPNFPTSLEPTINNVMTQKELEQANAAINELRNNAAEMYAEKKLDSVDRNHAEIEKIQDYIRRNS